MLSTIERVLVLRKVDMFADTPDDVLADVAWQLREVQGAPGERLINQGDPGTTMYVVVSGSVRVHQGDAELVVLGENDVFGELAALDPEPRSASVTTIDDTLLLALEHAALLELVSDRPEVARGVIRFLCRRVRQRPAVAARR